MTMPPLAETRRGLAAAGSPRWRSSRPTTACADLSMGTTQDFAVAVEEGATIVRVGTKLYRVIAGDSP